MGWKLPKIKIESRSLKYGYANARVKAMKGLLLKAAFLDELIKIRSIEAMVELLQRTHYKDEFVTFSLRHKGSDLVQLATGKNFVKVANKLRNFAPKDDLPAVEALLRKWETVNLKFLLNAKRVGKKYEEIKPYLFPVGRLSEQDYERIAAVDEKELFDEVKKTPLGKEMLSQSSAFLSRDAMQVFNQAMKNADRFLQLQSLLDAYGYLLVDNALDIPGKDVKMIRKILQKEIDAKNIIIIERLKSHNTDKSKIKGYLIKAGTLNEFMINELIEAKDIAKVVQIAKGKFPKLSLGNKELTVASLEIALEKAVAAEKVKAFERSVLSIGVLLGFLLLKEEELNNIRKIAKAKEFGISEQETREMLVVV